MNDRPVALITGGGTGIGRGLALGLARAGLAVAVNYSKSRREAEETAREVESLGVRALVVRADVADDAQVCAMVDRVVAEFGRLDYLVNNAAWTEYLRYDDLDGLTDAIWDRCFAVNVKGAFHCIRAAVPHFRGRGGSILNVTSAAGLTGLGSSIAYAASKAALINLTKALARALAPKIRVNAVAPGLILTRWVEGKESYQRAVRAKTPLQRNGTVEDVVAVALPLLLHAEFVTGQVVSIDGELLLTDFSLRFSFFA